MAIKNLDWWYDGQQRRFLEQVVRAFSGFQYQTGIRAGQPPQLVMVPCRIASTDRVAAAIMRNNSENTLLTVPMITVAQTGLIGRRADVQNPALVEGLQVVERAIDPATGLYASTGGNTYTVRRLMPRPFEMRIQVDIWTSNLDQKYQLAEQILPVIYPTFDLQNSDNPLDWTALTMMHVEDDIVWSSRSLPVGTENEIDVMTINLRLPIWLSPPAQVQAQKIIQQVVSNIWSAEDTNGTLVAGAQMAQLITTPDDARIRVDGSTITLLNAHGGPTLADGSTPSWTDLLSEYGAIRPGVSEIRLLPGGINGSYIAGTITPAGGDALIWQIDATTLPANTLAPVEAIIDPMRSDPLNGGLPAPTDGVRYLLIGDIVPSQAWGNLTARVNDIIAYANGAGWSVAFVAAESPQQDYVLNAYTGKQLRWTGTEWVMSIDGEYGPGHWRVAL